MASGVTNRGKFLLLNYALRGGSIPTNYYVALVTDANTPTSDTNTLGQLTEIAAGNGYTAGGFSLAPGATDFDSLVEDDTDTAFIGNSATIQAKNVAWTASGGGIPASGDGARYAVLTTDEGTVGDRQVIAWWDLSSARTVSDTFTLTLADLGIRIG